MMASSAYGTKLGLTLECGLCMLYNGYRCMGYVVFNHPLEW